MPITNPLHYTTTTTPCNSSNNNNKILLSLYLMKFCILPCKETLTP